MNENENTRYSRTEIAEKMEKVEDLIALNPQISQRRLAEELAVPRNTLQHWLKRREQIDAEPELIDFLESSVGLAFLHRLVIGSIFTLTMVGNGSPRTAALLLQLSGLDRFVACSVGSLYNLTVQMEEAIIEFGRDEQKRLAGQMSPKKITVCQDETFHPEVCLVAIEAASNYILLEKYAKNRKAATWNKEMAPVLGELPIEVIQSTSDEGAAILSYVKNSLQAHHSPDLFHVQQELVKATAVALRRQLREAQKAEFDANKGMKAPEEAEAEPLTDTPSVEAEAEPLTDTPSVEAEAEPLTDTPSVEAEAEPLTDTPSVEAEADLSPVGARFATPSEPLTDTTPQPAPSELQADTALQPALGEPLTDTAPQPAPGKPLTDTVLQPPPAELQTDTVLQPPPAEPLTASQPALGEPLTDTAPQPAPGELKTDTALVPATEDLQGEAQSARQKAQERIDTVAAAIKNINQAYHPFNLQNGEAVEPKVVEQILLQQFSVVEKIADEASLSVSAIKRIQKAKRVLSQMIATLTFFFLTITAKVTGLMLEKEVEEIVLSQLIPAIYLDLCSKRTSDRILRKQLTQLSSQLLSKVNARDGPLSKLSPQELVELEKVAIECAQLWRRSSSCVEGRNGRLALWHHSWSRLSERKLNALTTVHNFFIKRADATTAAERFFGQKPKELFPWLLERLTLLGRPAQKRPRPMPATYLDKVA